MLDKRKTNKSINGIIRIKHDHSAGHVEFISSRSFFTVPKVVREFYKGTTRMYECENEKIYVAETYDRIFIPQSMPIKPKGTKDEQNYRHPNRIR